MVSKPGNRTLRVLKTGARSRDLPEGYPSGSTCWRRPRQWDEDGTWLQMWRAFLGQLDARGRAVVGEHVHRRLVRVGKKRGPDVGKTKRGKGTKWMVVVDGKGIPLGIHVTSASPAEVTLVDATLKTIPGPPGPTPAPPHAADCRPGLR